MNKVDGNKLSDVLRHRAYIVKKTCDFVTSCRTPPGGGVGGGSPADLSGIRVFRGFLSGLSENEYLRFLEVFLIILSAKMKRKRREMMLSMFGSAVAAQIFRLRR